jgi:DNA-binding LacI/PurR family transcriptional regulator
MGFHAPEQVSLACYDYNTIYFWLQPEVTYIDWDSRMIVRRIVKWANNISRGKEDRRKTILKASLVLGGTIGPVKR